MWHTRWLAQLPHVALASRYDKRCGVSKSGSRTAPCDCVFGRQDLLAFFGTLPEPGSDEADSIEFLEWNRDLPVSLHEGLLQKCAKGLPFGLGSGFRGHRHHVATCDQAPQVGRPGGADGIHEPEVACRVSEQLQLIGQIRQFLQSVAVTDRPLEVVTLAGFSHRGLDPFQYLSILAIQESNGLFNLAVVLRAAASSGAGS
jgi:hypothetical protein